MNKPQRVVQLLTAHAHLLGAAGYLNSPLPREMPSQIIELVNAEAALSEAKLKIWMDALAASAELHSPRAGFWKNMEHAAELLHLPVEVATYQARFKSALSAGAHDV